MEAFMCRFLDSGMCPTMHALLHPLQFLVAYVLHFRTVATKISRCNRLARLHVACQLQRGYTRTTCFPSLATRYTTQSGWVADRYSSSCSETFNKREAGRGPKRPIASECADVVFFPKMDHLNSQIFKIIPLQINNLTVHQESKHF